MSLTNNENNANIGIIIRKASQAEPLYADVQNKIGFLLRSLTKGQAKRVYTAMHYGTNNSLKTSVSSLATSDVLSPATAYTAYIFSAENMLIARINFSTEAVPAVENTRWIDNPIKSSSEIKLKLTLATPNDAILNTKLGEALLLPVYVKFSYPRTGLNFIIPDGTNLLSCTSVIGNCAPSASRYAGIDARVFTNNNNYILTILAIKSISTAFLGKFYVRDGGSGKSNITLTE